MPRPGRAGRDTARRATLTRWGGRPGRPANSPNRLPRPSAITMRWIGWPMVSTSSAPDDPQRVEPVRRDHQHATDTVRRRRVRLVDRRLDTGLAQRQRRHRAGDAAANDQTRSLTRAMYLPPLLSNVIPSTNVILPCGRTVVKWHSKNEWCLWYPVLAMTLKDDQASPAPPLQAAPQDQLPAPPWRADARARAKPRMPLTRDVIIEAALRILDREGVDGLSMHRVARELGTGAASLYWHVRNKDESAPVALRTAGGGDRIARARSIPVAGATQGPGAAVAGDGAPAPRRRADHAGQAPIRSLRSPASPNGCTSSWRRSASRTA